jgi:hypothetical protein
MSSSGMLRRMAVVKTYISEERSASIIRVTRLGDLVTLAVTSSLQRKQGISSQRASVAN